MLPRKHVVNSRDHFDFLRQLLEKIPDEPDHTTSRSGSPKRVISE